jgi:excisionase family DNA binding protein
MTYLTTKDLQDLIRVDKSTIYRMAEDGRIPAVKVGRQWRFPETAVREMLGHIGAPEPVEVDRPLIEALDPVVTQAIADLAAEVFGSMVVITAMDGRPLTEVSNPCGLFAVAASSPAVIPRCIDTWAHYGDVPDLIPSFQRSMFGFLCARSFIRVGSELLGMMIVGGIAPPDWPPSEAQLRAISADLGIAPETIEEHLDEVYHLDAAQQQEVLALLPKFSVVVSHMAGSARQLVGRLDAIASLVSDLEPSRSTT